MSSKTKTTATKEEARPALVPKLRFPEFRGAEGWEEKALSEFMSESRLPGSKGNVAKKITVKLWGNGVFEKNDAIQGSINTQYFRRKAGQFIYSKLDFLNQAFGIIPPILDGFESTVDLPCFDFTDGLSPGFLLEYVKRRDFYERLGETADGSRKARRIHAETFLSFPIALPIPAEQHKIAECLSSVDEMMAAQARKVDALKTHKKGLMQQLFPREGETQPHLRFPEFQNAGEWEETKLGKHVKIQSGYSPSGYVLSSNGEYAFVKVEDLNNCIKYQVSGREFCDDSNGVVPMNSILFPKRGAAIELNKIRITATEILIDTNLMALTPKEGLKAEFLYYFLSNVGLSHIADTSTIPQINNKHIIPFDLRLPAEAEQQRIATCLSSLDALITAETQKLEALKTRKKGLMQQVFPSPEEVEA
jgi:type I restriction enzyme, S subunit